MKTIDIGKEIKKCKLALENIPLRLFLTKMNTAGKSSVETLNRSPRSEFSARQKKVPVSRNEKFTFSHHVLGIKKFFFNYLQLVSFANVL